MHEDNVHVGLLLAATLRVQRVHIGLVREAVGIVAIEIRKRQIGRDLHPHVNVLLPAGQNTEPAAGEEIVRSLVTDRQVRDDPRQGELHVDVIFVQFFDLDQRQQATGFDDLATIFLDRGQVHKRAQRLLHLVVLEGRRVDRVVDAIVPGRFLDLMRAEGMPKDVLGAVVRHKVLDQLLYADQHFTRFLLNSILARWQEPPGIAVGAGQGYRSASIAQLSQMLKVPIWEEKKICLKTLSLKYAVENERLFLEFPRKFPVNHSDFLLKNS